MTKTAIVSLLMRVGIGIIFLVHGIAKFQSGLGNIEGWFSSIGLPGFLADVVAVIELVGGILLIVGLFTRYVSAILVIVLLGAIFTAKLSAGLLGNGQSAGYELDLGYILIFLHLIVAESSTLSLDHLFSRKRQA